MRQQLLRSARRAGQANATRHFSQGARRKAEVELTIDGKKVSIEGENIRSHIGRRCGKLTHAQPAPPSSKPARKPEARSRDTATTRNS